MATVDTLTLYSNKGSSNKVYEVTNYYVSTGTGDYRIYYKIPITLSNETLTSFTLTTGIRVTNGGQPQTHTIYARLYTDESKAKTYADGQLAEENTGSITIYATKGPIEFTFSGLNITSSTTLYVSFKVNKAGTKLLEIINNYYEDFSTSKPKHDASVSDINTTPNNYTISYNKNNANSGSVPLNQTKNHGTNLTLHTNSGNLANTNTEVIATYTITFDAAGGATCNSLIVNNIRYWSADNWNTKSDGTGTDYNFGGTYTANSSATMYVKWGTHYRTESITLPETYRTGYIFNGWKIGNSIYNVGDSYIPSSSVTAIAQWSSNQYKVIFDGNGGTPSKKEIKVSYGLTYGALPSASRIGYTFNGWFTSKTGGAKINSNTAVSITANQTLYAQWTAFEYAVKYETNGGSTTSNLEVTAIYDTSFNLISNISKDTFDLKGWNTRPDGSGTMYSAGQAVTNLTSIKNGVVTLYAIWETSPYEITYNVYGNEYVQENVKQDSDLLSINEVLSRLKIKLNNWDRFDNWIATGNGFTDLIININDNVDDLTKVASKNESPRTITLNANIKPRFKIVYYNNGRWNRISAIRYDNIWKKITLNINK